MYRVRCGSRKNSDAHEQKNGVVVVERVGEEGGGEGEGGRCPWVVSCR